MESLSPSHSQTTNMSYHSAHTLLQLLAYSHINQSLMLIPLALLTWPPLLHLSLFIFLCFGHMLPQGFSSRHFSSALAASAFRLLFLHFFSNAYPYPTQMNYSLLLTHPVPFSTALATFQYSMSSVFDYYQPSSCQHLAHGRCSSVLRE